MRSRCRPVRCGECWISGSAATPARRAALDILRAVAAGAPFADARDRYVGRLAERDRRLAHALAAGVLRHRAQLDRLLDLRRADRRLHDILRLGAFQLQALARVPAYAAVSTSVDLAREEAGGGGARFVNAALRRLADRGHEADVGESHPAWLLERWRRAFGREDAERLAHWNDSPPNLTLQPAGWNHETLDRRLRDGGWRVTEAPFGAGLRVTDGQGRPPRPVSLPGFAEGGFIVQDAAAALVCRFAALPAGATVYDACAAPGGKAVTLEAGGARRIIAGDVQRQRLPRLVDTLRRAGRRVRVVAADLEAPPFAPDSFDAVLVDAPCTATGVIARHPDARWRLSERAIARSAGRQTSLLQAAATLVRPGGILVYATCSLEAEENENIVNAFLEHRPEFRRAPAPQAVPSVLLTPAGDLQALPPRHGTDGAYAARLERAA